jgi:hypothetical protein
MSHEEAYRAIRFELEAYGEESAILAFLLDPINHDILISLIANENLTNDQLNRISNAGSRTDAQTDRKQERGKDHDDPFENTGFCSADNMCH